MEQTAIEIVKDPAAPETVVYSAPIVEENKVKEPEVKFETKTAKATFTDSAQLKKLLNLVNLFGEEQVFHVTREGLKIRAMDPRRIMMIDLDFPKHSFEEYETSENLEFCVNVETLRDRVLKNLNKMETVTWAISELCKTTYPRTEMEKLSKIYETSLDVALVHGNNGHCLKRNFTVSTLGVDRDAEVIPEPKIGYTCDIRIMLDVLNKIGQDLQEDHFKMTATQETRTLRLEQNGDLTKFHIDLSASDAILGFDMKEQTVKAVYSTEYMLPVFKALKDLTDVVTISYSTDMPVMIQAVLQNGTNIRIWVAPRIEEADF
jgi:proliferating cell nuclear antigen